MKYYAGICIFLFFIGHVSCNSSEKKDTEVVVTTSTQPQTELEKSISRGAKVYKDYCIQCHLPSGKGIKGLYPPLDGSDWLTDKRTESIHAVKYGLRGEITVNGEVYNNIMLPLGLKDEQVVDVMNYLMHSWSNTLSEEVTLEEVKSVTK